MINIKFLFIALLFPIFACSPLEMGRRVAGTSIEALQNEKKGRFSRIIQRNVPGSYAATVDLLKGMGIYIYLDDEEEPYLVAMGFNHLFPWCVNTTEVGFFFEELDGGRTQVAAASPNWELAQFASTLLVFEPPEKEEKDGFDWVVRKDLSSVYEAVLVILRGMRVNVYPIYPGGGKPYLMALGFDRVFSHCLRKTEAAFFFFREIDPGQTRIDLVSLNPKLEEMAYERLIEELEKRNILVGAEP